MTEGVGSHQMSEQGVFDLIPDVGDAGTFRLTGHSFIHLVGGTANQTRTLARPAFLGQMVVFRLKSATAGTQIAMTVTGDLHDKDTPLATITWANIGTTDYLGDTVTLIGVYDSDGALAWSIVSGPIGASPTVS